MNLLAPPKELVSSVNKQLVLDNRPANISAGLILQQVGFSDPVCIIEPIVGSKNVTPVIPEAFPVPMVGAARGNYTHLRGAQPGLGSCVLRRGGELLHLAQHQKVGRVVEGFGS